MYTGCKWQTRYVCLSLINYILSIDYSNFFNGMITDGSSLINLTYKINNYINTKIQWTNHHVAGQAVIYLFNPVKIRILSEIFIQNRNVLEFTQKQTEFI